MYETRCLTCQEQELKKIQEQDITEQEKTNQLARIKLFKYIGESSRSKFERGWEHVYDLTSLKSSSHMLKHVVNTHPEQDLHEVHFGMKIIRTCKTSFERQIFELVAIQQEREHHHILNSRSEYNRCSLPRLSTQMGDNEYKKLSEELALEKQQEEQIESKIRNLRKQRNKERLVPSKTENAGTKRRKINENNEYITIQEIWGEPQITEQTTRKSDDNHDEQQRTKKLRTHHNQETPSQNINEISGQIKLTNIRTINREKVVPPNTNREGWESVIDLDKVLREHKERIEREQKILNENLEKKRKKRRKVGNFTTYANSS